MAAQEVVQKHGRLFRPAKDRRLFHAMTAVTGVAPGTALGTTAAFALHNPIGSGVDLSIESASLGYISGTLGAGVVLLCINDDPQAAAPTGTAIVEEAGEIDEGGPAGVALTTATLAATPKPLRPLCSLQASLASTAVAPWQAKENVEGAIVIPPGCTLSIEAVAAAGTSPLVVYSVTWEEITIGAD